MRYQDFLNADALADYAAAINRRAAQAGAAGRVVAADLRDVILESGGRCAWCGARLVDSDIEIDHIEALVRGGANTRDNLACTCPVCNRRKGDRSAVQFALERVAAGGAHTPLINRLLRAHGATPAVQRSLFDDDTPPDAPSDVPPDDVIPPYRW